MSCALNVIYYVEVNLICIVILLLFGNQFRHKTERFSTSRMVFTWLLWATIILCVADMVAGLSRGQDFLGARSVIEISNLLYFEALAVISYLWMAYVLIKLELIVLPEQKKLLLWAIPLIGFTLVALSNPLTHFLFSIDENNLYARGAGVYLHWVVSWFYLVVATWQTARAMIHEENQHRRQEIAPLLYFVIPPAVAGVVQMLFYGVTSSQVGVTISIVAIFLEIQNNQVLTDALTGLNNRRSFENYMADLVQHHGETDLSLLMLDLNRFKEINDKFGHMTGDKALQEAAAALKQACLNMSGRLFLCRYGGDEFVVTGNRRSEQEIEQFKALVSQETERSNLSGNRPYRLEFSIGVAGGRCADAEDVKYLLRMADRAMYEEKKLMRKGLPGG